MKRSGRWIAIASGPALWGVSRLFALRPELVEQVYGERLSRWFAMALGAVTGLVPVSVAEVGAVVGGATLLWGALAGVRASGWRALGRTLLDALTLGSLGYAIFLAIWGMGAHRTPVGDTLGLSREPASVDELAALYADLVDTSNRLRSHVPELDGVATVYGPAIAVLPRAVEVYAQAGETWPILSGHYATPKPVIASPLMSATGVLGIYIPFTGEANVDMDVPAFALPFDVCHEMAHQRGFTREDEANFVAWRVLREAPDVDFRYSAAFFAQVYVARALAEVDEGRWRELRKNVSPEVLADADYWWAWVNQTRSEKAAAVTDAVNDTYLKSQGSSGMRSYGEVVDLLLADRRARLAAEGK